MIETLDRLTETRQKTLIAALHGRVIPGLDAMRAIAITLVVLYHQGAPLSGALGVIIFFVLSGFLITSLLVKEIRRSGTISLSNFYRRRAYRIFPAFYLCWIVTTAVMLLRHQEIHWGQAAASFFYLADYGRAILPATLQGEYHMGISWSLAIEEQFYLLWPITLLYIAHRPKRAVSSVVAIILAVWIWRAILFEAFAVPWGYIANAFDTRVDALMIGSLVAMLVFSGEMPAFFLTMVRSKWLALIPIAALALSNYVDLFIRQSASAQLANFALAPIMAAVVLVQWVFWGATSWTFLEHPAIKWIARLSYSIYLFHPLAIGIAGHIRIPHAQRLLTIPVILAFASASYYTVERPFLRLRDRAHTHQS